MTRQERIEADALKPHITKFSRRFARSLWWSTLTSKAMKRNRYAHTIPNRPNRTFDRFSFHCFIH